LLKLDTLIFPPLDFSHLFRKMHSSVSARMAEQDEEDLQGVMQTLIRETEQAERTAEELYEWIEKSQIVCPVAAKSGEDISQRLLGIFRKGQDYFVRLAG
jgi:N-acetylated-alpha-linked acidic dipeptidase